MQLIGAMRGNEGAFAACTFSLAEALALTGRAGEGSDVFATMLGYRKNVALLSEEVRPETANCSATSRRACHIWR